jgi:hypothetical protein
MVILPKSVVIYEKGLKINGFPVSFLLHHESIGMGLIKLRLACSVVCPVNFPFHIADINISLIFP